MGRILQCRIVRVGVSQCPTGGWRKHQGTECLPFVFIVNKRAKVGIRNLSPHFRNSTILRTTRPIAELRTKKSCGTAIADLQNLTSAIPQLSTVSGQFCYFLVTFREVRMVLKSTKNIFRMVCFYRNQQLALRGQ
jgi:hypothetical protein